MGILGLVVATVTMTLAAAPVIAAFVATGARAREVPPLILAFSTSLTPLLLSLYQKEYVKKVERGHGRKHRGMFDISRVIDVVLIIILMPTLLNLLGSLAGANFGALQPLFSTLIQILPIVVVLDLLTDVIGGAGGSAFKKVF